MTTDVSESADAALTEDTFERVRQLRDRLHLENVRVQRLAAQTFADPPLAVASILLALSDPEVLVEPPRFSCRFSQHVTLKSETNEALAEVEIVLVVDFALDEGPDLDPDAVAAHVDRNIYFIAHPYLREALQDATTRLGLDPVILGVLAREDARPAEVTLVPRRTHSAE